MKNKVTIKDIAREAGVSVATVSYVINNREDQKISDKTKKKILADLNYLLEKITIISLDKIDKEYLQEAFTIVKNIDEDDYPFIALHLQIKHKIWSRDQVLINGLTAKGYGHFFITTEQMKKYLYKK